MDDAVLIITSRRVRLLMRLQDNGPTRITDLATVEDCSQPTITDHIKRLEAAHLVQRHPDPTDARASLVSLTETGEEQLTKIKSESRFFVGI